MSLAKFQAKQQQNKRNAEVREFFEARNGKALYLSDDPTFVAHLRNAIKELAIPKGELYSPIPDAAKAFKVIAETWEEGRLPTLFIERVLGAVGDTSLLIRQLKDSFPALKIFVVTTVLERDRTMLLYEAGADNFIIKPISGNELLEKMAVTLRKPGVIQQLLDTARSYVAKKVGGDALTIIRKVLEVKPDNPTGYVVMGDALRVSGNDDKAKLAYERACKYSDQYLEPLQRLADMARENEMKEAQLEYLKRLDSISPLNTQRKVEMGELYIQMGNTEAATQLFDTAVTRAYKNALLQVATMAEKIAASLQDVDPVQAEKYLRQCLQMKGDDLTVDDLTTFNQLGLSLRKQGRWEDAIVEYKRALKIAPKAEGLYYNIAMAFAEGEDYTMAVRSMLKALSLNPDFPRTSAVVAFNMGKVFSFGYAKDKALQCLEIAYGMDPHSPHIKKALLEIKDELRR